MTVRSAIVLVLTLSALTQAQTSRPADAATSQPVGEGFAARVIRLQGSASYALIDDKGERGEWKPLKVDDQLAAGSVIRTQMRARAVLAFGDDTVVAVEPLTMASIDQFRRAGESKKINLGLGHGTIRAGVQETTLRSDMTIETPTATLSKRGTMDFGISYEPSTSRFRIFLAKEGLVEAIKNTTGQSRFVHPGQYVTQAMMAWIDTLSADRWIPVVDTYGLTGAEELFQMVHDSGIGVIEPGGGSDLYTISGRDLQGALAGRTGGGLPFVPTVTPNQPAAGTGVIPRPEGNFGTGSGSLSVLFKRAN